MTEPVKVDAWDNRIYDANAAFIIVSNDSTTDDEIHFVMQVQSSIVLNRKRDIPFYEDMYFHTVTERFQISLPTATAQNIIDREKSLVHYKYPNSTRVVRGHLSIIGVDGYVYFTPADPVSTEVIRDTYAPPRAPLGEDD